MQKGQHEYATRKAHELFDAWNDVTGVFPKFTGYYYEILAVVEDAVRVGSMVALGVDFEIIDGEITQRSPNRVEPCATHTFCYPSENDPKHFTCGCEVPPCRQSISLESKGS